MENFICNQYGERLAILNTENINISYPFQQCKNFENQLQFIGLGGNFSEAQCIYIWGLLSPNGILPGTKFTLRPSLAFSYIGSVTIVPYENLGNLVFWFQMLKLRLNQPQALAPNAGGVGKIAFFDQARNLRLKRIIDYIGLYICIHAPRRSALTTSLARA